MASKRGPNKQNQSKTKLAQTIPQSQIEEVFSYWKETMGKKRAVLDIARTRDIGWAIAVWGIDGARDAIDGCKASAWHMGKNASKTVYNDVTLIFRDAEHVERFQEILDKSTGRSGAKKDWIDS